MYDDPTRGARPHGPTVAVVTRTPLDPRTPVIIGVGQTLQRHDDPATAGDATELMAEAIRLAAGDTGASHSPIATVDVLAVVNTLSWRYGDPARVVSERLGIDPAHRVVTPMGGNSPQSLVNAAAEAIGHGELDLAVLVGGETWRTRMRARRQGVTLEWPKVDPGLLAAEPPATWGHELTMNSAAETDLGLIMPVQVYPMFESALRAARQLYPSRPLTALFQPHLFTRTRDFLPEFAEALQEADTVVLLPIYPARELPLPGITSEALAAAFPEEKRPLVLAPQEAVKWVLQANPSLLMTLGAGDIDRLIPTFERHFAPISQN